MFIRIIEEVKGKADEGVGGGGSNRMSGWGGEGGMVKQIMGCFSQGNLVSALKTMIITGSIRSQVFVHTFSSFWKSKCMGLNGVLCFSRRFNSCPK